MADAFTERKRWGFFGIPWTFTVYHVKEDILTIDRGFLNRTENDCFMYKIADVKLERTFFNRIFGLGKVICFTSDVTERKIEIKNIKHSKEVKDYILMKSEEARLKRRTLNMQNIGADANLADMDIDGDGTPDGIFD